MKYLECKRKSDESGVALLFALGILALLMVLGLAFVSTALLSQRVAVNNGNRAQAKMLAQSAINRIAISVMMYQHELAQKNDPVNMAMPRDFTAVYSFSGKSYATAGDDAVYFDQLEDKLYYKDAYGNEYKESEVSDTADRAQWIYFTSGTSAQKDDNGNAERYIGRIAYRVLPETARINLNAVLGGVLDAPTDNDNAKKRAVYAYNISSDTVMYDLIPWANRRGRDIEELYIDNVSFLTGGSAKLWQVFQNAATVPASYSGLFMTYKEDLPKLSERDNQKWFVRWFSEGYLAESIEAYSSSEPKLYHRFNLGNDFDTSGSEEKPALRDWYVRLGSPTANTQAAIDELAKNSEIYIDNNRNDDDDSRRGAGKRSGLPFLKKIANDKASFDSLTKRRRQIAANLNDYCDTDSIPTAEPAASTWTLDSEVSYSGNEKTLYINEIGVGGSLRTWADNAKSLHASVIPAVAAELIDIYGGLSGTTYKLFTKLGMSLELTAKCTVKYSYADTHGAMHDATATVETSGVKTLNLADTNVAIDKFSASNGYHFGVVDLAEFSLAEGENAIISEDEIKQVCNSAHALVDENSIKITGYEITVIANSLKYSLGSLLLNDGANNVDFTNTVPSESFPTFTSDAKTVKKDSGVGDKVNTMFVIGGMEVKDPRQNLNIKIGDGSKYESDNVNYKLSDWIFAPKAEWPGTESLKVMTVTSTPVAGAETLSTALAGAVGKVNTESKPNAPGKLVVGSFDPETVPDPARTSDTAEGISTAFIRNAPMQSLWELGAIHRGAAWETINLKGITSGLSDPHAVTDWGESGGTAYNDGDGAILDEVKMTPYARSMGKVDLNTLGDGKDASGSQEMAKALLSHLKIGEKLSDFSTSVASNPGDTGTAFIKYSDVSVAMTQIFTASGKLNNRSDLLRQDMGKLDPLYASSPDTAIKNAIDTDAGQEEIIGKIAALLTVNPGLPTTIRAIVLAQTIKDIGGADEDAISVTKAYSKNGKTETVTQECKLKVFDMSNEKGDDGKPVYFDEITGEIKMLVTFSRHPTTGRLTVRGIEYID